MGNWWLAALSKQCTCSCIMCHELFWWNIKYPGDSASLQPRFCTLQLMAFPKTKITFERGEIPDRWWRFRKIQQGSWWRFQQRIFQSVVDSGRDAGRTVWGPKVPTLKGTKASLSYVQCFLFLVLSSVNVSIFHSAWLDTLWTGHIKWPPGIPTFSYSCPDVWGESSDLLLITRIQQD